MSTDNPIDQMCLSLVEKKRLTLTVEVTTPEQAREILSWMYAQDKPMKATLLEMSWNRATVPVKVAEALQLLHAALTNS